jgi:hypothetical protein
VQRALAGGDAGQLPLRFRAEVLDRYREIEGAQLMRTRTVGRVSLPGRWTLDVGIVADDAEIEVPFAALVERLPEAERPHWLDHLARVPVSENFAMMRLAGNACIDDGEPERW